MSTALLFSPAQDIATPDMASAAKAVRRPCIPAGVGLILARPDSLDVLSHRAGLDHSVYWLRV
jgi:hypothetical protein